MGSPTTSPEPAAAVTSPTAPALSATAELVYLCSRTTLAADQRARIAALAAGDLDWRAALTLALGQGVLPLCAHHLLKIAPAGLPPDAATALRHEMKAKAQQNLFMLSELVRLHRLLAAHGIESIHFKGPVLAVHAFHNLALREFCDLDILVHHRDAPRVRDLLHADGFESTLSAAGEAFHLRKSYWLGFEHPQRGTKIDLHWKLADPFFRYEPDLPTLWARSQPVEIGGAEIRTFGAEDTVMVLAAHGFKHAYSRLKWVSDLAEWIRAHPGLDWAAIQQSAEQLHVRRILAVSLLLVQRLDAVLPQDVHDWCATDSRAAELVERIWTVIFAGGRPLDEGFRGELFHAKGRERTRDAAAYLWWQQWRRCKRALAPNEKDRAMVRLPRGLGFLYFGLRPIRLLGKALTGRRGDDQPTPE